MGLGPIRYGMQYRFKDTCLEVHVRTVAIAMGLGFLLSVPGMRSPNLDLAEDLERLLFHDQIYVIVQAPSICAGGCGARKLPTEAAVEPHVETSGSVLPAHLDRDLLRGVVAWNAASAGAYGL